MGRLEDLAAKWESDHLDAGDEDEVLLQGVVCPAAKWVTRPNGAREIQCPLYGPDTQLWVSPNGKTCRTCLKSPQFDGRPGKYERARVQAARIAAGMGDNIGQARAHLASVEAAWRIDPADVTARRMMTYAIALAPNLPDAAKVALARERGLVQ